jgi:tRNA pseudouridine synthase 10
VQEEIQKPFMRESKAVEAKFHGGGREDVDAKCLGKREFVLELIEPLNRDLDLEALQEEVNESTDKVEVFGLKFTHKDKAADIKQKHADKEYRAVVETEEEVSEEDLEKISEVVGEIEQDTPERVEHRRAEKTRKREVYEVDWEKTSEKEFILTVKAEAGTYIKELIHGDEGRTQPNISELIGTPSECVQLDVTWIEK